MSDHSEHHKDGIHPAAKPFMFLLNPKFVRGFIWLPLIGMLAMIVAGYFYPQKHSAPFEFHFFGSWAVIGFLAYSFVVLSAKPLFNLLSRPEDYYGEGGLPEPFEPAPNAHHEHGHEGDHNA